MNKHFTLVAAFLMVAVSAPAQDLRGPRSVREGATASRAFDDVRAVRREEPRVERRAEPRVEARVERRAEPRDDNRDIRRDDHRGDDRRAERGHGFGGFEIGFGHHGPVLRFPAPAPRGHWETVCETVLVEAGHWHEDYVPPVYGWVYDHCGCRVWGIVEAGYCRRVWCPPRYETRTRQVWVAC